MRDAIENCNVSHWCIQLLIQKRNIVIISTLEFLLKSTVFLGIIHRNKVDITIGIEVSIEMPTPQTRIRIFGLLVCAYSYSKKSSEKKRDVETDCKQNL